jgi:hypothetical protein
MARMVVWSGGIDSTAALQRATRVASPDNPVRALVVTGHPSLSDPFMRAQAAARARYLTWTRAKGRHVVVEEVGFTGTFVSRYQDEGAWRMQPLFWLEAAAQAVGDGDVVTLGYVKRDSFWHIRREYEAAFMALCALKGIHATVEYPWEWHEKDDVLGVLRAEEVPDDCWFTCEMTGEDGVPCGTCHKCRELALGMAELNRQQAVLVMGAEEKMAKKGGKRKGRG